jgi:RNA polymerase sigma-70 factor (ECF subfamily)
VDDAVTDAYLAQRAQQGYLDAYAELVRRHSPMAYRVALRITGQHQDAEDVAQESLVAAWEQLPRFRATSQFSTWLYRIVTRRALNRAQRRPAGSTGADLLGEVADPAEPAADYERDLTKDAVADAIHALPPPQRAVIVLHYFEKLSYAEVASITNSTVPAVRSHLSRARRTLGSVLAQWR